MAYGIAVEISGAGWAARTVGEPGDKSGLNEENFGENAPTEVFLLRVGFIPLQGYGSWNINMTEKLSSFSKGELTRRLAQLKHSRRAALQIW